MTSAHAGAGSGEPNDSDNDLVARPPRPGRGSARGGPAPAGHGNAPRNSEPIPGLPLPTSAVLGRPLHRPSHLSTCVLTTRGFTLRFVQPRLFGADLSAAGLPAADFTVASFVEYRWQP